jgi:uncharacterized membrane protein
MDLQTIANLGDAVGGFSTLAGLVFALVSVNRWRRERRDDRRSNAAAKAISAIINARAAVTQWVGVFAATVALHEERFFAQALKHARDSAAPRIEAATSDLSATVAAIAPHLTDEETRPLGEMETLIWKHRTDFYLLRAEQVDPDAVGAAAENARAAALDIERRALEMLRPIAQFDVVQRVREQDTAVNQPIPPGGTLNE